MPRFRTGSAPRRWDRDASERKSTVLSTCLWGRLHALGATCIHFHHVHVHVHLQALGPSSPLFTSVCRYFPHHTTPIRLVSFPPSENLSYKEQSVLNSFAFDWLSFGPSSGLHHSRPLIPPAISSLLCPPLLFCTIPSLAV